MLSQEYLLLCIALALIGIIIWALALTRISSIRSAANRKPAEDTVLVDVGVMLHEQDTGEILKETTFYKFVPAEGFEDESEGSLEGTRIQLGQVYIEGTHMRCSGLFDPLYDKEHYERITEALRKDGWSAKPPKLSSPPPSIPQKNGSVFYHVFFIALLVIGAVIAIIRPLGIPMGTYYVGRYDALIVAFATAVLYFGIKRVRKEDNSPYAKIADRSGRGTTFRVMGVVLLGVIIALSADYLLYPTYGGDLTDLLLSEDDLGGIDKIDYYPFNKGARLFNDDYGTMGFKEAYTLEYYSSYSKYYFQMVVRLDPRSIGKSFYDYIDTSIMPESGYTELDIASIGDRTFGAKHTVYNEYDGSDMHTFYLSFTKEDVWIVMIGPSFDTLAQYAREIVMII